MKVERAKGRSLTALCAQYGLKRKWWEPDFMFRRRAIKFLLGF